jgi:hypothetical protein
MIMFSSEEIFQKFVNALVKQLEMVAVEQQAFLGINILQVEDTIVLDQTKYVEKLLDTYQMCDANVAPTISAAGQRIDECDQSPLYSNVTEFQELLGSLTYLATSGRPDIAFQVNNLSRYNHAPRQMHMEALKRILRYLKGTKHLTLHVTSSLDGVLSAAADASWDSTPGGKSVTGYCINIGPTMIAWKTKRQPNVALSSCEAEVNAICDVTQALMPIRGLVSELCPSLLVYPIVVKTDSKSAIDMVRTGGNARSRHFDRRFNFVKDEVMRGNIKLVHIPGTELVADVLTKNVSGKKLSSVMKESFALY